MYNHTTSISKNVYINRLDKIVDKYNKWYHGTIKNGIEHGNIPYGVEHDDKDPRFEVGNRVRISKHKNIFAKGYTPNWSDKVFVINKNKNTVINDLNDKETVWKFYEKELQKTSQTELRIEKVIKKKVDRL